MILVKELDCCLEAVGLFHSVLMVEKRALQVLGGVFDRLLTAAAWKYIIAKVRLGIVPN